MVTLRCPVGRNLCSSRGAVELCPCERQGQSSPALAVRAEFLLQSLLSGFSDFPVNDVYGTWKIQFTAEGINNWLLSGITLENKSVLCMLNKWFSGISVLGACKILPEDSLVPVVSMLFFHQRQ